MTSILGHAEKMIHDLKHEFRLEVANTFPHPLHQVSGITLLNFKSLSCIEFLNPTACYFIAIFGVCKRSTRSGQRPSRSADERKDLRRIQIWSQIARYSRMRFRDFLITQADLRPCVWGSWNTCRQFRCGQSSEGIEESRGRRQRMQHRRPLHGVLSGHHLRICVRVQVRCDERVKARSGRGR